MTAQELRNGQVIAANLLNPAQTELPHLSEDEIRGIVLGPLQVELSRGYLTALQEEEAVEAQQINYQTPDQYHHDASQVGFILIKNKLWLSKATLDLSALSLI